MITLRLVRLRSAQRPAPPDWPDVIARTGVAGPTKLESMNWDDLDLSPEVYLRRASQAARRLDALRRQAI